MSHAEDLVPKVMEVATRQFKLQMYDDCLRLFTRAIDYANSLDQSTIIKLRLSYKLSERPSYAHPKEKIHHPKLVALLDNRAATLEKLRKYEDALKDSQDIIKIEPYNVKGYLRCGKLLQILKQDRKAFQVYVDGIKKIDEGVQKFRLKVSENMIEMLKARRSQLKSRILEDERLKQEATKKHKRPILVPIPSINGNSDKRSKIMSETLIDPVTMLPSEVMELVLQNLTLKQLVRCLEVSQTWNKSIVKMSLYNNIKITQLAGIKEVRNCCQLILKSKKNHSVKFIKKFEMNSIRRQDEKQVLVFLLTRAGISITDTLNLSFLDITMEQIVEIIQRSSAAKQTLETLRNLKLKCVYVPSAEQDLLSLLPNLESLQIIPSPSASLQALPLAYTLPTEPYVKLRSLYIVGSKNKKHPIPFHHFFQETSMFPNLRSMTIVGCNFQSLNQVNGNFNFLVNFLDLESLVFENNEGYDFRNFLMNHDLLHFTRLGKFALREKKIEYAEYLHVYDTLYLERIFSNLKILDLTGSSITYFGLRKILNICGMNLKQLSIGFCSNLVHPRGIASNVDLTGTFNYDEFVNACPVLEVLYLNQATDFCDYSLTLFINAILRYDLMNHLKLLDLSFNSGLSGFKLLEFVRHRNLALFILNGVDIKPETVKHMEHRYVTKVVSRLDKPNWKEYGTTSYDPLL